MANYNSAYTGAQIDSAVGKALNPQTTPTSGSNELISSGGVKSAIDAAVTRDDVSTRVSVNASRVTVTTRKVFRFSNRIDCFIVCTMATGLTDSQQSLFRPDTSITPSYTYIGIALINGTNLVPCEVTPGRYINVHHGGVSIGDTVTIQISWFYGE